MANTSSMWTADVADWVASGPGAGNGLDHVRALFKIVYPEWQRGLVVRLTGLTGVDKEIVQRVFRSRTWNSIPNTDPVIAGLATVLNLPITVVLFAFVADLHPKAVDDEMYCVLHKVAQMTPAELEQMHRAAGTITSRR